MHTYLFTNINVTYTQVHVSTYSIHTCKNMSIYTAYIFREPAFHFQTQHPPQGVFLASLLSYLCVSSSGVVPWLSGMNVSGDAHFQRTSYLVSQTGDSFGVCFMNGIIIINNNNRVFLCILGHPLTHDLPASVSLVLGLQMCTNTPGLGSSSQRACFAS